eukprot:Phypoly_transcript_01949.p1 GENE.Phypoly_transcript_01949~~Phypoly_transcript_01949.p1  ORF type:complete len:973 (+),score=217.00 Phypoly_transcript_01949:392-2920(+)
MEAKKFELAKKAFETASDFLALLNLFIVANYRAGLIALRKTAEEQADKFTTVLIDNSLTKVKDNNTTLSDPPSTPNLYAPTTFINVSMRMGGEFLSPLNLNSLSRWLTTSSAYTVSSLAFQIASPAAPAAAPLETKESKEKQDLSLVPPKRFGSLRSNQQKLSSKTTLSSSSTLRRAPSNERIVSLPVVPKRPLEELLVDDTDVSEPRKAPEPPDYYPAAQEKPQPPQPPPTTTRPPLSPAPPLLPPLPLFSPLLLSPPSYPPLTSVPSPDLLALSTSSFLIPPPSPELADSFGFVRGPTPSPTASPSSGPNTGPNTGPTPKSTPRATPPKVPPRTTPPRTSPSLTHGPTGPGPTLSPTSGPTPSSTPRASPRNTPGSTPITTPRSTPPREPSELARSSASVELSEPAEPTKPSEPSEPAEPANPGVPDISEPTELSEPAELSEPSQLTEPIEISEPEPADFSELSEPTELSEPAEPCELSESTELSETFETEPTEPPQPSATEPSELFEPITPKRTESQQYSEPSEVPSETSEPAEPSKIPEPLEPSDPSKTTELAKPSELSKSSERPPRPKRLKASSSYVDPQDNPFGTLISRSALGPSPPYFSSFPPPLPLSFITETFAGQSASGFSALGSLSQSTQAQLQAATDQMKQALRALEKGFFDESLTGVTAAAQLLASVDNPALTRRELRLCVAYSLALRMLRRLREYEASAEEQDAALLSKLLAGIPIQPKHRVVVMRMAVNKNMAVGNYDSAAKILEMLTSLELPDQALLEQKWMVCYENEFLDSVVLPYDDSKLCFLDLRTHSEDSTICSLCYATFSEEAAPSGTQCPFCCCGSLQRQV